jgi:glyoxylase I family protein
MTLALHHLAVVVADLGAAEAFYANVLGLPLLRRLTDDSGRPRSFWLGLGQGAFLAVEKATDDAPRRTDGATGWHCVALAIEPAERDAWRARLLATGHTVERESPYTIYTRDPDGNLVALSHHPEPAPR